MLSRRERAAVLRTLVYIPHPSEWWLYSSVSPTVNSALPPLPITFFSLAVCHTFLHYTFFLTTPLKLRVSYVLCEISLEIEVLYSTNTNDVPHFHTPSSNYLYTLYFLWASIHHPKASIFSVSFLIGRSCLYSFHYLSQELLQ